MSIEIIDILLLLAAAQGFFLAILIIHKHRNLYANRFLAAMLLAYSALLLYLFLEELDLALSWPQFILFILGIGFIIGPLHYLYTKYLIRHLDRLEKKDLLHGIPFLIFYSVLLLHFPQLHSLVRVWLERYTEDGLPAPFLIYNWMMAVYSTVYLALSLYRIMRYARIIRNHFSTIQKMRLDWLRNITLFLAVFLTVYIVENILYLNGINLSNYFTLSSTLFAAYIYTLGYLGLFKSEILMLPEVAESMSRLEKMTVPDSKAGAVSIQKKYDKSGLSPQKAEQFKKTLLALMEQEAPYRDSGLTLQQLSELLHISPHNLSEVINTRLHQNFFDFVNAYRVEKVKKDLADPAKQNLTMLAIAYESGFNSKTAFNNVFKKHTRMTPSEYRRHLKRRASGS